MARRRQTREEQRHATRAAILATATKLFLKQGIEATSLDAVAARLGLTKGAIYANFASKPDLVRAVAEAASSGSADALAVLLRPDLSLTQRLRRFARSLVTDRFSRELVLLDLEYLIYAARNRRWARSVRRERDASLQDLADRFRAVTRRERLPLDEVRFLELLMLVGRGIIQKRTVDPGSLTASDAEAMVCALLQKPRR